MRFIDWLDTSQELNDNYNMKKYFSKKYVWAEYAILILGSGRPDINIAKSWCSKNLTGRFDIDGVSFFELEEDALMFTLRWA